MYRRGPPKSTPANVQCQKCLKRGHYSYECKTTTQDRPYVPRPSRTQQLFNPKLVPKLASDTTDALQKQKGVADEELAKREAERAKKRELEDEGSDDGSPKRRRSASYDSVSSISTRRSLSPPPRAQQSTRVHPDSPRRGTRSPSPISRSERRDSYSSASDYDRSNASSTRRSARNDSPSGERPRRSRSLARDSSPVRSLYGDARDDAPGQRSNYSQRRRYSSSPSRSPPPHERRQFRSRSPDRPRRRDRSLPRDYERQASRDPAPSYRNDRRRGEAPPRREQRERSLSPFSKRLALTQAMNMGR
ncbi:zinc knuckle-domain-containing protein [Daldinia bambusicola]|nr:zinc knuckle-domain-containing protein [Daldinia bambusicola]